MVTDYDIIVLTWLNMNVGDSELGLTNFTIYRFDRNENTSNCTRGGGTLIAVKNTYNSTLINISVISLEHLKTTNFYY